MDYHQNHLTDAGKPKNLPAKLCTAQQVADKLDCGITAERLLELAAAEKVPHFVIDNGPPLFRFQEVALWVNNALCRYVAGVPGATYVAPSVYPNMRPETEALPDALVLMGHRLRVLPKPECGPGIYFLCDGVHVVYVGQSVNPAVRIGQHVRVKTFDRVYVLPVPESELDAVEGAFIRLLTPKYNYGADGKLVAPAVSSLYAAQRYLQQMEPTHEL